MTRIRMAIAGVVFLGMGLGATAPLAAAADAAPVAAKPASVAVISRTVNATWNTGRYMPSSFKYSLRLPTLAGTSAKVKAAFDARIDALVKAELTYYSKSAWTVQDLEAYVKEQFTMWGFSRDEAMSMCGQFQNLKGKLSAAVYEDRYASVVLTFSGQNWVCGGLGGLWVAYQTDRSVTIDAKTGKFAKLTDFTSNKGGKVSASVKTWYKGTVPEKISPYYFRLPTVTERMTVCDRPGNVITVDHKECIGEGPPNGHKKPVLVAWQVRPEGLRLTFPGGARTEHALLDWDTIPRLK
ncbi:MAG: hypothetical protein LBJ08_02560 [Bifidobacteriaceae bacterium]|jgi:hypothetical protein|nr:hypothetical protein [Bifidobacteriaceae bacterium]